MSNFSGWGTPHENWCKMPHALIDALPIMETEAEIKVVLYVLRHTWGYQDFIGAKRITMDEFQYGRRRMDGSRIDGGTGLTINSIRDGIKRAIAHGLLQVDENNNDSARQKRYYKLSNQNQPSDEGESLMPNDDGINIRGSNFDPRGSKFDPQGSNFDPRTEKDTLERNCLKDLKSGCAEPQTATTATVIDYSSLPDNDPRRTEHLRGLGIVNPDTKYNSKKVNQIIVNDQGLTERLRTALVNELIKIRKAEALIALGNEDDLMEFQRHAEELYRMGVDSAEKMAALGVLWWSRNTIVPNGRLFLKFQSQILADMQNGESLSNNGEKQYASNGRGRGQSTKSGGGQLAEWESKNGEVSWHRQIAEKILKQWPAEERRRYHTKRNASRPTVEPETTGDGMFVLPAWFTEQSGIESDSDTFG